jgi:hypothetical protein
MRADESSPKIEHLSWGRMDVGGRRFKDAKCFPGGARAWDWGETGTSHTPGTQFADAEELLEHGAEVVILSTGINERLQVPAETREAIEKAGARAEVLQTERAVERYNELAGEGRAVGGLFHSTC